MILITSLALSVIACKKQDVEPETIIKTETVTIRDTIWSTNSTTYTVTIHDTVYISTNLIPLNGIWNCWKVDMGGSPQFHNDWVFTFGNTTFTQTLGSTTYNYPITYYSGSVDIFFTTGVPTTYYITTINNDTEYKLTKNSGTTQVWYLKK